MKTLLVIGLLALLVYLGMNAIRTNDVIKMDPRTVSMEAPQPAPPPAPTPAPEPKSFTVIIEEVEEVIEE